MLNVRSLMPAQIRLVIRQFAEDCAALARARHFAPALMLRLAASGLQVERLVQLRRRDILDPIEPRLIARWLTERSSGLLAQTGIGLDSRDAYWLPVSQLVRRYVRDRDEVMLDIPLFASNRGGGISPRTAERRVRQACEACKTSRVWTLRDALGIGRMTSSSTGRHDEQSVAPLGIVAANAEDVLPPSMLRAIDREDVVQQTVLQLLEAGHSPDSLVDCTAFARLAARTQRDEERRLVARRETHLESWSWITADRARFARSETSPVEKANDVMLKERVAAILKTLTYREREIVKLRFGMGDGYVYTDREIAKIFKVHPRTISRVFVKAISKLRHPIRAGKICGFAA